jgi:hypothetical protein
MNQFDRLWEQVVTACSVNPCVRNPAQAIVWADAVVAAANARARDESKDSLDGK